MQSTATPLSITFMTCLARTYAIVPPPPTSTAPSSAVWNATLLSSMILRSSATYSALASLDPPFPPLPVYLLNTRPCAKNAEFFFSKLAAYNGSNAALTSEESILEFAIARRNFTSEYPSTTSISSTTAFSKNLDVIPVAPTLPISSLSTRIQHAVLFTSFVSNIASKDVNAQTLSSCPYAIIILLSIPHSLAFPAGTISSSAERKSSSSML